jgi:hypothetical protein
MPGPLSAAERRPDSTICPKAVRGTVSTAERPDEGALRLDRGTGNPNEPPRTSPDVQVVLVTEGGLELPLVASPAQVARLLDSAREGGSGNDRDGLLPSPTKDNQREVARRVRADQLLGRVRVVIRPCTVTRGDVS